MKKKSTRRGVVSLAAGLIAAAVLAAGSTARAGDAPVLTLDPFQAATEPASAPATSASGEPDLTLLPLEDLINIQVFSAAKQAQRLTEVAAAITVISQEDIRRSGMNSIPELLRMAPGVHVAQVSSGTWAIGSRGMNQTYNNNLLVLMDGRTLYSPLFAGVYWDTVDYVLADLDRVEVIRGPGATLWGANAVNGVINITTKSAKDTQGLYVQDYTGTDGYVGSVRYGGKINDQTFYRVYAKYRTMGDFPVLNGAEHGNDGWDYLRGGFRVDADLTPADTLTVEGGRVQRAVRRTPDAAEPDPAVHGGAAGDQ